MIHYPEALLDELEQVQGAGVALPASREARRHLLDVAFYAGVEREEGRSLRFSLVYMDPTRIGAAEGPFSALAFSTPRQFSVENIVKLAPAHDHRLAAIGVNDGPSGLQIWGFFRHGVSEFEMSEGLSDSASTLAKMDPLVLAKMDPPKIRSDGRGAGSLARANGGRGAFSEPCSPPGEHRVERTTACGMGLVRREPGVRPPGGPLETLGSGGTCQPLRRPRRSGWGPFSRADPGPFWIASKASASDSNICASPATGRAASTSTSASAGLPPCSQASSNMGYRSSRTPGRFRISSWRQEGRKATTVT